jgi:glycerol-3-phosphate dehydrogenase
VSISGNYDVIVIGSGLVGAAIAFDLHQMGIRVMVLEREADMGAGVSRTNSGILHTGFDSTPGTLEIQLIRNQAKRWPNIFDRLEIPYQKIGALLLAKDSDEAAKLESIRQQAQINGVSTRILNQHQVKDLEPHAAAQAALHIPDEAMTDPYEVVRRFLWGIEVRLETIVTGLEETSSGVSVTTSKGIFTADTVINCAGLFADEFTGEFKITPRRGEFIVFERQTKRLVNHILLPLPNEFTKGVLVFPTIYGYICAGPTAEDQENKHDWQPHQDQLPLLQQKATEMLPALKQSQPITAWAGLRTVGHPHNYFIEFSKQIPNLLHVAGIRSTGLSACLGISEYVVGILTARGLENRSSPQFSKPSFSDTQPWWERHNAIRNVKQTLSSFEKSGA